MPDKLTEKRATSRDVVRTRLGGLSLARLFMIAFGGLIATFFFGFGYFVHQVQAANNARAVRADAIVVFSGEPKRIGVAVTLLARGYAHQLFIVGQDNGREIAQWQLYNKALFQCCVKINQSSVNTAEDARLANRLLKSYHVQSLILVTSSFHMPRAIKELSREIPQTRIIPFGVTDDFYRTSDIPKSPEVASAFLAQYVLYIISCIPGNRLLWEGSGARGLLASVTNLRHLAVFMLAVLFTTVAVFAFARHRDLSH